MEYGQSKVGIKRFHGEAIKLLVSPVTFAKGTGTAKFGRLYGVGLAGRQVGSNGLHVETVKVSKMLVPLNCALERQL